MGTLARATRTLLHLRLPQLAALFRKRVLRVRRRPAHPIALDSASAYDVGQALVRVGPRYTSSETQRLATLWLQGVAVVPGATFVRHQWEAPKDLSPLAKYHFYYHDQIAEAAIVASQQGDAAYLQTLAADLNDWAESERSESSVAWDPYPTSIRTVNWIRMHALGVPLFSFSMVAQSFSRQLARLANNVEIELQANHLLRNYWAIALCSLCALDDGTGLVGKRMVSMVARYWSTFLKQVDVDGFYEEPSAMYQLLALRDAIEMLAVCRVRGIAVPQECIARIDAMRVASSASLRPDGSIRTLHDTFAECALEVMPLGIGPLQRDSTADPRRFSVYASARRHIARVCSADGNTELFVDACPPLPRHQPGHSHASALSFELRLRGRNLVLDPGASGYDGDPMRPYFRSTRAHSTLTVDQNDQSELWGTFRVGGRASSAIDHWECANERAIVRAHCVPFHDRSIRMVREFTIAADALYITDHVTGIHDQVLTSRIHFAPECELAQIDCTAFSILHGDAVFRLDFQGKAHCTRHRGESEPLLGWCAPRVGVALPTWCAQFEARCLGAVTWTISIRALR